jgi:hypothetical protein
MRKKDIKVGMRVKVVGVQSGNYRLLGKIGFVKQVVNRRSECYNAAIQFCRPYAGLHTCDDACAKHRGYWFVRENLAPAPKKA